MHPQVPQLCLPGPIRPFQAGFAWGLLFPWLAHYSPGVPRGCHSLGPTPGEGNRGGYHETSDHMNVRWLCFGSDCTAERLSD